MTKAKLTDRTPRGANASAARWWWAAIAGVGWAWAVALVSLRDHDAASYRVIPLMPPAWGVVGVALPTLLAVLAAAVGLTVACVRLDRSSRFWKSPTRWLLAAYAIGALDVLRFLGIAVPPTFLEPLFLAVLTGAAAGRLAAPCAAAESGRSDSPGRRAAWLLAAGVVALAAGGWWHWQSSQAYAEYLLGFNDFGVYALRLANTWHGRGFLMESADLPAFYDHFNPSLALLAPLWGLLPDARLFFALQAVCLAGPALCVYGIARAWRASPPAAFAWAVGYLTYPAVGQINLSYSYGWHPVSLAMFLLFAGAAALAWGRRWTALACAVVACGCQEDVLVVVACLCLALAALAWRRHKRSGPIDQEEDAAALFAGRLSPIAWIALAAISAAAFVAAYRWTPMAQFQTARFAALGDSPPAIALSPLLRPAAFWGQIFQINSACFLLMLLVPLGVGNLLRGWRIVAAAALPLGVLLAWDFPLVKTLGGWYYTTLVPIFLLAAMAGASRRRVRSTTTSGNMAGLQCDAGLAVGGVSAMVTAAVAAVAFGAWPWSGSTLNSMLAANYRTLDLAQQRAAGSEGIAALDRIVAELRRPDAKILASGRVAAHLLGIERVDVIQRAAGRLKSLGRDAAPERSPLEPFDAIVVDTSEFFLQSEGNVQSVFAEAGRTGFQLVYAAHGIVVLRREPERPNAPPTR